MNVTNKQNPKMPRSQANTFGVHQKPLCDKTLDKSSLKFASCFCVSVAKLPAVSFSLSTKSSILKRSSSDNSLRKSNKKS